MKIRDNIIKSSPGYVFQEISLNSLWSNSKSGLFSKSQKPISNKSESVL